MSEGITLIHVFEETVKKFPQKCAVCMNDEKVTYTKLEMWAKSIATALMDRGVEVGKPIVIAMNKSPKCLATMLGVLYTGNAYTILDVKSPVDRISKIITTLGSSIVIFDQKGKIIIDNLNNKAEIESIMVEDIINTNVNHVKIESVKERIIDFDPAYVLFTSGSTGIPKGTVVGHGSVIAYVKAVSKTFNINEKTIFGNQTPFYFSMSVLDIFVTIYTGATLVLIPKSLFSFPLRLFEYIKKNEVNTIYWVPTAMEFVADRNLLKEYDASFLKKILFAGEPLPPKYLNIWKDALPNSLFANLYGPTEVTDTCTYYICDSKVEESDSIPIGRSFDNCDVFLLDGNDMKIEYPSDTVGEICVRGAFLAYGYYNNHEQTLKSFVKNPTNPYYDEFIYRTGDLGKWKNGHNLIYCGRKDYQIKHMGYRIELGEIENVLSQVEEVSVVVAIYDERIDEIIVCYTGMADESILKDEAKNRLPSYMHPKTVFRFDSFPINANGKIDRKKIKENIRKK